jgi:hypothetical protein
VDIQTTFLPSGKDRPNLGGWNILILGLIGRYNNRAIPFLLAASDQKEKK